MDKKQKKTVAPKKVNKAPKKLLRKKEASKDGIGFRWQYLVIYLLIASVISYKLVDFKVQRDTPTTEPSVKVTTTDAGKKGSKWTTSADGAYAVPGTIGEGGYQVNTTQKSDKDKDEDKDNKDKDKDKKDKDKEKKTTKASTTTTKKSTPTTSNTTAATTKATTAPPVTEPPVTSPPVTEPPVTEPPSTTESAGTE